MEEHNPHDDLETYVSQMHAKSLEPSHIFDHAVEQLPAADLSLLLEALPLEDRFNRWLQIPDELKPTVLVEMRTQARDSIIRAMDASQIESLLQSLDAESLIELSVNLDESQIDRAYQLLDVKQKIWYRDSSQFEEDQIGRFVDHEILMLPPNTRTREALRAVKRSRASDCDQVFIIDRSGHFQGVVPLSALLNASDESLPIRQLVDAEITAIAATESLIEAADELEHSGLSAMPVVDEQQHLIGRITLHMALWIQRENFESKLMARAGLNESSDLFVPVVKGARVRALWLGINLLTAFLASWTIGLFENVLSQVVALAVLMPVVASMGGIAGSQTLTLIIRGLATRQVTFGNSLALCKQELSIALLNGVAWAVIIGVVTDFWFDSIQIGVIIAAAVMTNIVVAAFSGVYIPLILDRLRLDPALSGAVLLTTVTDVVGFITFLGLGTLLIL